MRNVLLVIAAIALTACGTVHPTSSTSSGPIPWLPLTPNLVAPPAPSPQPMPVPAGTPPCTASDLRGLVSGSQGATGHIVTSFIFWVPGKAPCFLSGTPSVALLDASGNDLGFNDRAAFASALVGGQTLVEPGPEPLEHEGLKFGQAALYIDWIDQPEACLGEPIASIAKARVSFPAGGSLTMSLPASPGGYRCQGVGVSSFDSPAMPVAATPKPPLPSISIDTPASVQRGHALDYVVTLTNTGTSVMNLAAQCPTYQEVLVGSDGLVVNGKEIYALNCTPAGTIPVNASARFAMVLHVPADAPPGTYRLTFMLGYWNAMTKFSDPRPVAVVG